MKIFFIKLDTDIVRDVIDYAHEGYTEVSIPEDVPTPPGLLGGFYRWNGTEFIYDQSLKDEINKVTSHPEYIELNRKYELLQKAMDDMILGGAL
ncbi:hypothetical protein P4H66_19415 [Paenibacillus dokdonensis]|uniref:Phage protein n=1 Tax=Paenibacillus dokdonensis TaxID=2567944 RepID=A0ABU6GTE6_9BACL|nr:hypothetical protein [Paenibacillus dokdonensis]MEC0241975.1 hypothetical protein [Paenibacillus dokdonensis]